MLAPDVEPSIETRPPAPRTAPESARRARWLLAAAIVLGLLVRLVPVASHDFPLNDGALFYQMALEIRQAGFSLPSTTAYNADGIPFTYAPLGFYLAALVGGTPEGILAAVRWIPLIVGCLMLPAFVLLARAFLRTEAQVIGATFAFALVPRAYLWIIMGGGLTRSLGMLFTMLALWQTHLLYTRRGWRRVLPTAALMSLAVLSHLGTAPFLIASTALLWVAFGRHREGLLTSIAVGALTLAFTAPWWATAIGEHGLAPFQAAQATGGSFFSGDAARWTVRLTLARLGEGLTAEPLFPLILGLGLLGSVSELSRRRALLPGWWALILFIDIRAPGTYAAIPIAMLAGVAATDVLLPVLRQWQRPQGDARAGRFASFVTTERWSAALMIGLVGYATFGSALRTPSIPSELTMLTSLDAGDRAAMRWVASETPRDSRILVVTGGDWAADRVSEWFPVLAARKSVATVQGSEWLPDDEFDRRYAASEALAPCARQDMACIDRWSAAHGTTYSHLYITKTMGRPGFPGRDCCTKILASAMADPRYRRIYDGPGAAVFVKR